MTETSAGASAARTGWILAGMALVATVLMVLAGPVRQERDLESAIGLGLRFLAGQQSEDGIFPAVRVRPRLDPEKPEPVEAPGVTALAVLALADLPGLPAAGLLAARGRAGLREPLAAAPVPADSAAWAMAAAMALAVSDPEAAPGWLRAAGELAGEDRLARLSQLILQGLARPVDADLCERVRADVANDRAGDADPAGIAWLLLLQRATLAGDEVAACLAPLTPARVLRARAILAAEEVPLMLGLAAVRTLQEGCPADLLPTLEAPIRALLTWRRSRDGGWPALAVLPMARAEGDAGSRALTTALAVEVLERRQVCRRGGMS